MWEQYRRTGTTYTPVFVSLAAVKDPARGAVEEALADVGLRSLMDKDSVKRRWLVILDGFDEVQGATNFVIGNKLARPELPIKVR